MRPFLLALTAAAAVVVSGPFVGELNTSLLNAFPDQHLGIVVAAIVIPAFVALGVAAFRIRTRRVLRYGAFILALAVAGGYAAALQPSYTEQFHLTEYAVLTFLFYRVWRDRGDTTALVLPVAAALVAGLADEWFQWFVPSRIGELRDVVLNGVGISAGLLVALALDPPPGLRAFADDRSRRLLAGGLAVLVAAAAVFLQAVHLGHQIDDPAIGSFRSRYSTAELAAESQDRARRWSAAPLESPPRISREDHYLSEAMYHVRRRNDAVAMRDFVTAWPENLVLERYYEPVLRYASPGSRWPPEQRAEIAAAVGVSSGDGPIAGAAGPQAFVSDASPLPIYAWSRGWVWGPAGLVLAALVVLARPRAGAPAAAASA